MLLRPGQTSVGNVNQVDMIHISNRLASYNTWKLPFISTIDLASAGFYHYPFSYNPLSFNDFRVKCAFCSITHSKWDKRSNPLDIHKKISPKCSFINLFFKDLGNIEKNNYIISDNISDIKDIEKSMDDSLKCIICLTNERNILCLPCKHLVLCEECSDNIINNKCCFCREIVVETMKIYVN